MSHFVIQLEDVSHYTLVMSCQSSSYTAWNKCLIMSFYVLSEMKPDSSFTAHVITCDSYTVLDSLDIKMYKLWLKLPPNIRQMEDKGEFKSATKRHFGL